MKDRPIMIDGVIIKPLGIFRVGQQFLKWASVVLCLGIFVSLFSGCAGLEKTKEEPVHTERGAGITLWKIPIIGFGSWGNKENVTVPVPAVVESTDRLGSVRALVFNQNEQARHKFLLFEGSYNREQLFLVDNGGPRLKVEPIFRGEIGPAVASNLVAYGEIGNLLPRSPYTILVFSETPLIGKFLDVSVISFYTSNDNLSSCYQFWNKKRCAAVMVNMPMISQSSQVFQFEKTIDMGAFIDSLF